MTTYVAFLRAINLGRTRQFPKDAIRAATEATGCTGVETYINTGNVRLDTRRRSRAALEAALEKTYRADRGFDVPTVCFTAEELREIAAALEPLEGPGRQYVELLKEEPPADLLASLAVDTPVRRATLITPRALHLAVPDDAPPASGQLPAATTRRLGTTTNRNTTVLRDVVARWCS